MKRPPSDFPASYKFRSSVTAMDCLNVSPSATRDPERKPGSVASAPFFSPFCSTRIIQVFLVFPPLGFKPVLTHRPSFFQRVCVSHSSLAAETDPPVFLPFYCRDEVSNANRCQRCCCPPHLPFSLIVPRRRCRCSLRPFLPFSQPFF